MQLLQLKDVNIQVDYHEQKIISKLFDSVMMLVHVNVFDVFYYPKNKIRYENENDFSRKTSRILKDKLNSIPLYSLADV
jgi:hypothetical protein